MQRSPSGFGARAGRRLKDLILRLLSRTGYYMVRGESERVMAEVSEQAAYTNRAVRDVRALVTEMAEQLATPSLRSRERVLEAPYALRALTRVPSGSPVLAFGSPSLALALSSLGYEVSITGAPSAATPYHPRLRVLAPDSLDAGPREGEFAAVVALSGASELTPDGQLPMSRIRSRTRSGGLLVLARVLERRLDRRALARQLEGWQIEDVALAEEVEPGVWIVCGDGDGRPGDVALITAIAT